METELEALLAPGRVATDAGTLTSYSTDAGPYQIQPRAVVFVREADDVKKVVVFAAAKGISVTPRGAGSNLGGGAIGTGIVLEFSKFNGVVEVNKEEKTMRVRPGARLSDLERSARRNGLFFPVNPASAPYCTIGGMVATNAFGARSPKYGTTGNFVLELKVVLPTGAEIVARQFDSKSEELQTLMEGQPALAAAVAKLAAGEAQKARKDGRFASVTEFQAGSAGGKTDLTRLFVGTEGTFGIVTEIKLRLLERPKQEVMAVVQAARIEDAAKVGGELAGLGATSVELLDQNALETTDRRRLKVDKTCEALIVAEFLGDNLGDLPPTIDSKLSSFRLAEKTRAGTPEDLDDFNSLARIALRGLHQNGRKSRQAPFSLGAYEIPSDKLSAFIKTADAVGKEQKNLVPSYAVFGTETTLVIPLYGGSLKESVETRDRFSKRAIEYGGRHRPLGGSGRYSAERNGEKPSALTLEAKRLIDPSGILNPDVLWAGAGGEIALDAFKSTSACIGCGACNDACPVHEIFNEEQYGPRGWVRLASEKDAAGRGFTDYCIECKLCLPACPTGVDVPQTILESRARYPTPLAKIVETTDDGGFATSIVYTLAGKARVPQRVETLGETRRKRDAEAAYFYGCCENLLISGVAEDLQEILNKANVELALPKQKCCGAARLNFGHTTEAKAHAKENIDSLLKHEKIVTTAPQCAYMLRHYETLFPDDEEYREKARAVARRVYDFAEFFLDEAKVKFPERTGPKRKVRYLMPCALSAQGDGKETLRLLKSLPDVELLPTTDEQGCCGAGLGYGLVKDEVSKKLFEASCGKIESGAADAVVTSSPFCQMQLMTRMDGKKEVKHIVQLVAESLRGASLLSSR
ncbi:MAG: FAD-binding oxidoreductase [Euryarchaeota archaeon]|nr:FAD-binding oxidoreductase [Euryarchaeota archaeon]